MGIYNILKKSVIGAVLASSMSISSGLESKLFAQQIQPPKVEWEKTYGNYRTDNGNDVQQTKDKGFIIVGHNTPSIPTTTNVYLIKTDNEGNIEWERNFGGKEDDKGFSIQQTEDNGYIIAGSTESFGNGGRDIYITKTDTNGYVIWNKVFGSKGNDGARSVKQTKDLGYIVTGNIKLPGRKDDNVLLLKTDFEGNTEWEKNFGGKEYDVGYSVLQSKDGGFTIAGYTRSFGGLSNKIYLCKTDKNGNLQWQKSIEGVNGDEKGFSLINTFDGGYLIAGITINPRFIRNKDFYLLKTDMNGNMLWEKTFGGPFDEIAWSVIQTNDKGFAVTGSKFISGKNDPGTYIYLVKTDSEGNKLWDKIFGQTRKKGLLNLNEGKKIIQTSDSKFVIVGKTISPESYHSDVYLVKLSPDTTQNMIKQTSKNNFPERTPSSENLTFITHGVNSSAETWVTDMANSISDYLIKNDKLNWDIWTYDWKDDASNLPSIAAQRAFKQGESAGLVLRNKGYDHIHLIAHSAGCWLIDEISRNLNGLDITVNTTFLDAYVDARNVINTHGREANWAEHYFNDGVLPFDLPLTQEQLKFCYNIDVTGLSSNQGSHSWPHQWYLESIRYPETIYFRGWGFSKSKEYLGFLPTHKDYPRGELTILDQIFLSSNEIVNGDFSSKDSKNWVAKGDGVFDIVEFPPKSKNLVAQLTAGSPISISQNIKTPNSQFIISYEYAFPNNKGTAEIFIDNQIIQDLNPIGNDQLNLNRGNKLILNPSLMNLESILTFRFNSNTGDNLFLDNVSINAVESPTEFIRGDANADSSFDISDSIYTLLHLFSDIPKPSCKKSIDIDDSGLIDISDAIYGLNYIFLGGLQPKPPFPNCNIDRTPIEPDLPCDFFPCN